ncbi:MAG: TonB-dependent receptor [Bryobacteraceae bacterium]
MSFKSMGAVFVSALMLFSNAASGQILYGTLVGTITDPTQGAIVGAMVEINNRATGFSATDKSDDRGAYEFRNLLPGAYTIKITAPGFNSFEAKDVALSANNIARVDAALKVGSVAETITVGAEVAQLQTDKSDVHMDISAKELTQISLGGYRNFQSVIDFMPGTTPASFQNASTDSPARALTMNVNGTARNSNNTRIDGAASVFTWLPHHAYYIPPIESIETVNVSTNNFDAEQGMAGGAAVNVITKSGTNSIRAVLFEYHTNHKLGAKNLFFNPNTPAGPNTPQRIDNQFGGTVGGPIKKDQLFYFASWEGTTTAERGNGLLSVPTAKVRSGNMDGLATLYDPATGDSAGRNRTPLPGNQVPTARMSPQALALQNLIPLPNSNANQTSNFFASAPYYFKRNMIDAKMDYTPTAKLKVFGKYSVMIAPVYSAAPLGDALGGYPGGAAGAAGIGTGHNHTDVFGGGVSYVISPTLLVDGNFGGTLMHHDTQGPDYGKNIGTDVLKIPGTNGSDIRQSGFPIFNINGYTSLGNTNNWSPVERNDRSFTYSGNANWTKGAHNLRFGIDLIQHAMNHWQPEIGSYSPRGGLNFNSNGLTALNGGAAANNYNAYAGFLMGLPSSIGKSYQFYDPMRTREFQQGYYIRDNWQVNRKLNLNIGLRMEHFPIMNRGEFGIERYDPTTNKVLIGGRGNVPRNAGTDAIGIMWGPRVGLAYRADDKTVIRAGFGITNDPYPVSRPLRSPFPAVIVDEYIQPNAFVPPVFNGQNLTLATGIPAVKFPDLSTGVVDIANTISTNSLQAGKFRRGYIESFNFTFQRELGHSFLVNTGYVGTRSIRQALTYFNANAGIVPGAGVNGRPLFGQFGVTVDRNFFIPMATQRYDAWQSTLTKRLSGGLFATVNYSLAKAQGINAGNSDNGLRFYVPSQFSKNKAVSDFDRTHSFTAASSYELPFGKGKKFLTSGAGAAIAGGWQLNPTLQWYSGTPFIVGADGSSLNAPANTQVADRVSPTVKLGGVGLGNPFIDPSSFKAVSEVRFGNMGLNEVRGPWRFVTNLGLFRSFTVTERMNLQFRVEALNWTNTPTLANPNASVSSPSNFMAITATDANATAQQRTIRFGLRLAF